MEKTNQRFDKEIIMNKNYVDIQDKTKDILAGDKTDFDFDFVSIVMALSTIINECGIGEEELSKFIKIVDTKQVYQSAVQYELGYSTDTNFEGMSCYTIMQELIDNGDITVYPFNFITSWTDQ